MAKPKRSADSQVEKNFQAFQRKLPSIPPMHSGKFALMKDGEIVEFYSNWNDAIRTGLKFYGDGNFSVQQVENRPVDLGFFSHAVI